MNRAEHLQWCKDRALEHINNGDINQGITSMMSNIRKHPETDSEAYASLCMMMLMGNQLSTKQAAVDFINGFI